jgi:biotin carboxylase
LLPDELEVQLVCLRLGDVAAAERRLATIARLGHAVHEVRDRSCLPEVVGRLAVTWKAEGILALSERVVHEAGEVARSLGLPANSRRTQEALRDKVIQRRLLAEGGVAVPRWHRIDGPADLEAASLAVGFPAVLKPAVGSASLSVFAVGSHEELKHCYETAVRVYERDPRQNAEPRFLLERRFEGQRWHADPRIGDYVSVESLISDGRIFHLMVTDKFPLSAPFRETGQILPSTLPENLAAAFRDEAGRAIAALGMRVGSAHTEIKMTAEGPRVIEVNGRIGGAIAELMHMSSGYNVIAQMAAIALGRTPITTPPARCGFAAYYMPKFPAFRCRVTRAPTVEKLLSLSGVQQAEILSPVDTEPDWRRGNHDCTSRVFASSSSREELMSLSELLLSNCLFTFERLHQDPDAA